ncbi:MAG TPA: DUF1223 domain-containing protein [Dongiaceae bacterium]|jgi:hypothetical protein
MSSTRVRLASALAAAGMALTFAGAPAAADPVLVELFTSQGCSSCPPADLYLGELAQRTDVVALAFHVDYWDYIGWRDKFAKPEYTKRQKDYVDALEVRMVYTPQMVVDGRFEAVGTDHQDVETSINAAAMIAKQPIALSEAEGKLRVTVPAAEIDLAKPASLWLAVFARRRETPVGRGENAGTRLVEYHIVRQLDRLGPWTGKAVDMQVPMAPMDKNTGCAVILQVDGAGEVLGVAALPATGQAY